MILGLKLKIRGIDLIKNVKNTLFPLNKTLGESEACLLVVVNAIPSSSFSPGWPMPLWLL